MVFGHGTNSAAEGIGLEALNRSLFSIDPD
jgi:hypothetical protein